MEPLTRIQKKIDEAIARAGRKSTPVLIAVSKFQPVDKLQDLYRQGHRVFGENYVQELIAKRAMMMEAGCTEVVFHFIGKLQSNKVKQLLPHVAVIHSVDSVKLLNEIEKRSVELNLRPSVFFQLNIDQETSKSGFRMDEIPALLDAAKALRFSVPEGLMAIPDPNRNPRDAFRRMRELSRAHGAILGTGLSMGMSGDFEAAIEEGSTAIRVGTALFGEREN
jgi:pyridoxal phosphate enzyme (YggS family)